MYINIKVVTGNRGRGNNVYIQCYSCGISLLSVLGQSKVTTILLLLQPR